MKRLSIYIFAVLILTGCIHQIDTVPVTKLGNPYTVTAVKNYLPESVRPQPAYTIYEDSIWNCTHKTATNESVCCLTSFGTSTPWKYCLLVDQSGNGSAFYELGTNQALIWPEGKQLLFKIK